MIIICDYIYDFLFPRSAVIFGVLGRRFINRFWEGEIMLTPSPSGHSYYCELAPVSWFSLSMLFPIELIQNRDELCWIFFLPPLLLSSLFFQFLVSNLDVCLWFVSNSFRLSQFQNGCHFIAISQIYSIPVQQQHSGGKFLCNCWKLHPFHWFSFNQVTTALIHITSQRSYAYIALA